MTDYEPTIKQEQAIREYLHEAVIPLVEDVLVKKLGQAMSFCSKELISTEAEKQKPVVWVENLTDPQPHAVTDLKYCSVADRDSGKDQTYTPLYTAPPKQPKQEPVAYKEECWACGCEECICATKVPGYYESKIKEAVLAEREACAKVAEDFLLEEEGVTFGLGNLIRARGQA